MEILHGEASHRRAAELEATLHHGIGLSLEGQRSGDGEGAAQVEFTGSQGNGFLTGGNGGQEVVHGLHHQLGVFAGTALRQHCETGHAGGRFGVVDIVLAGVGIHVNHVGTRIQHAGSGTADDEFGFGHRAGLTVEHNRVAGGVLHGIPGNEHIGCFTCREGSRLGHGERSGQGGVHGSDIGAPGQLSQAHGTGREYIHQGFLGDGGDEHLLGIGHVGQGRCTALEGDGGTVNGTHANHEVLAGRFGIGGLDDQGAGSIHLEGQIAIGGNALTVGHGSVLEAQHTVAYHDGVVLGSVDVQEVTHHLLLDGTGEVLGVGQIPGVFALYLTQGKVFGFFHVRSPPLGSTYALSGNDRIRVQVEQSGGSVVAGIVFQDGTASLGQGEVVGEVNHRTVITHGQAVEVVVGSGHAQIGGGFVLGVGTLQDSLSAEVQEQVVLEAEAVGDNLQAEDTGVVGVVHKVQVVQGIVLHLQGTQCTGVEADEGTHTLGDGVVHKGEGVHGGSLTDVEHVTTHGAVLVDVGNLAAVVEHIAQYHIVAPFIHQALGVARDDAVLIGNVADVLALGGTAVLVLEGEAVSGGAQRGGIAVEFHRFKVQGRTGHPGVGYMEFTVDDRLGTGGILFTHDGETTCDIQGSNLIRRAFQLQEHLGTCGLEGVGEAVQAVHLREAFGGRSGPGIHLTAAGAQVIEGKHILLAGIQAIHGGGGSGNFLGGKVVGCRSFIGTGEGYLDAVHIGIIGHFLAPGQGNAGGGAGGDFQVQVVLHGKGLEGLVVFGHLGFHLSFGLGLHAEGVGLVGGEFLLQGNIGGSHFLGQINGTVGLGDSERVGLGVLGHIPGEGDNVAQGRAYAGIQVHGLQAAGQIQFFIQNQLFACAGAQNKGRKGENRIFDFIHCFHRSRVLLKVVVAIIVLDDTLTVGHRVQEDGPEHMLYGV